MKSSKRSIGLNYVTGSPSLYESSVAPHSKSIVKDLYDANCCNYTELDECAVISANTSVNH